jgi:signal transduction histidine kinase/heme-degrading monooxygenase HmoA
MIVASSRFKVANGLEDSVSEAFLDRPRLVEQVPGYLGLEVFTDAKDPAMFYLVTRWTDAHFFHTWHKSKAHHHSHSGMPKGLKLDPAFTRLILMNRLDDPARPVSMEAVTFDAAPFLTQYLSDARAVHFLVSDSGGTIRTCNKAVASQLKVPVDQVIGQTVWQFLTDTDAASLRERVESAQRNPQEKFLLNFVDVTQSPYTLECRLDVQPDYFVLIGEPPQKQDEMLQEELLLLNNELAVLTRENARKSRALEKALAELKEAQALLVHQEKMAALGQMTAGVAHEINNPIAFILNNHTTLHRDFEDLLSLINLVGDSLAELSVTNTTIADQIMEKAEEIELTYLAESVPRKIANNLEGLERVKDIVLDLRDFSRLDEGNFKPCDLATDIEATLRFLSPLTQEYGVTLETNFAPLPALICSPGPLNQAISNVVTNAIQASKAGQTVNISTLQEGKNCVITVTDHGVGIAPEHLPRVFDPFFTTKAVGAGTGLGLNIAYQVIDAHHGQIEINSQPGQGTTVRIEIPFRDASQ